jgi:hypothetical protein
MASYKDKQSVVESVKNEKSKKLQYQSNSSGSNTEQKQVS